MPSFVVTVALSALSLLVAANPTPRSHYAVKDSHPVPGKWSRLDDAPADHKIALSIALKQGQFDELERHLYEGEFLVAPLGQTST